MMQRMVNTAKFLVFTCLVMVLTALQAWGQTTQASYQRLSVKIDGEWSRRMEPDRTIYDNYNVPNAERAAVILYAFVTNGDAKTQFEASWKSIWPDSVAVSRPRRLYTNDGAIIYTNGGLLSNSLGSGYGQLYVYVADNGYQSMLVWYPSQNAFRRKQSEWNLIAQEAIFK